MDNKDLERQGYRLVGNHSAVKVCYWTRECIRGKNVCYKNKFYGINSHQCVQMTPCYHVCTHRCKWCWRDIELTKKQWEGPVDEPSEIIDGCIEAHKDLLMGFKGSAPELFEEAMNPKHFAISLSGEPTFYPKLPELIDELKRRNITSFLVTNGTNPEMLKKLINHPPTQLYLTIPAPDEETYKKVCNPLIDGWPKIMESLELLKHFPKTVIRLTLVENENMVLPEKYNELIKGKSKLVEMKGYAWVGHSQKRLYPNCVPEMYKIKEFAKKFDLEIIDEKEDSKVILLRNI